MDRIDDISDQLRKIANAIKEVAEAIECVKEESSTLRRSALRLVPKIGSNADLAQQAVGSGLAHPLDEEE